MKAISRLSLLWISPVLVAQNCDITVAAMRETGESVPYGVGSFRQADGAELAGRFRENWSGAIPCGEYSYRPERVEPRAPRLDLSGTVRVRSQSQWLTVNPHPTTEVTPNGQLYALDSLPQHPNGIVLAFEGLPERRAARWVRIAEVFGN